MNFILAPLKTAGIQGIEIIDGAGMVRRGHPILATYVGDYPEQILVTGGFTGDCPICDCPNKELGVYPSQHSPRNLNMVLNALEQLGSPQYAQECRDANIKPIQHPFWEDLPYVNTFQSITPDILHQLHQGVVKHLIGWLRVACGDSIIDEQVRRLPPNHSIHIFLKGITSLSRVSGTEHRQMSSFLLSVLVDARLPNGASPNPLIRATRSILDFLYLAQYPIHTSETLTFLELALEVFHKNKFIFEILDIRSDFNIPKLHFLIHYPHAIKLFGTTDNYSTKTTERLHIDFAKDAYQATNHKNEFLQMTKWLERQEKIMLHINYIAWRRSNDSNLMIPSSDKSESSFCCWETPDMACTLNPKMTRHPTRKSVSMEEITSPNSYSALDFEAALCRLVVQFRDPKLTRRQIEDASYDVLLPFYSLPIFHKIKFWNEEVHGNVTLDSIHAYPAQFKGTSITRPSRFDTALVTLRKAPPPGQPVVDGINGN
jgi:hypothetical protein